MTTDGQTSAASAKKARYRARQRAGRVVLPVEVPVNALAEAMIACGMLTAAESENRRTLAIACGSVLRQWAKKWRP